jgi:hypothetical protein
MAEPHFTRHLVGMDQDNTTQSTGTKRKPLSTELRAAIWEAHNKRCPYTGDLISFSELDIDHVVPITISSDELARLKRDKVIDDDFDLNDFGNLLPTNRFQNGKKSAGIRSNSALIHFLDIARQHSDAVSERLSASINDRKLLTAYLQLKAQAERNDLDVEDVIDVHRQQEGLTRLRHAPELVGIEPITLLNAALASALMVKPFALGGGSIESVILQDDKDNKVVCTNCIEFIAAQKAGYWPLTQFDMNCYGMADRNCGMLSALEHAKFAPESALRYPRVTCRNLDRWSSTWVRHVWIEFDEEEDAALFERCKSIADLVREGVCEIVQQDDWYVALEPRKGLALALSELFRADLDDDGKEEILVFQLIYAPEGTLRAGSVQIAKPDKSGILQPLAEWSAH